MGSFGEVRKRLVNKAQENSGKLPKTFKIKIDAMAKVRREFNALFEGLVTLHGQHITMDNDMHIGAKKNHFVQIEVTPKGNDYEILYRYVAHEKWGHPPEFTSHHKLMDHIVDVWENDVRFDVQ